MSLKCQKAEQKIYVKFHDVSCNSQLPFWTEKVFEGDTAFQVKFIQPRNKQQDLPDFHPLMKYCLITACH